MKRHILTAIIISALMLSAAPLLAQTSFADYPVYSGNDLGVRYSPQATHFKIWAPKADEVQLFLYDTGKDSPATANFALTPGDAGTWQIIIQGDIKNKYYTFQVKQNGKWLQERPDIYAKAVGVNGERGMVVDLKSTNPQGWATDKRPILKNFTDIIIYELHVRDLSSDPNSGIKHTGKFLGLTEAGTKSPQGESTGLDHIKALGVTHVHLLPSFDFNSVDETRPLKNQYNWGYDPLNYNAPEGSYATNAEDGNVRIREFKAAIQAMHKKGLRVILDVVYNHTSSLEANFNQFVPGYFYRHKADGSYSDATGCGNETASEMPMMRQYMVHSVLYWAKEYHLDGFRFDLMGVHDIETMNQISKAVHAYDPTLFIYGEGWTAGASPLDENLRAVKKNVYKLDKIAAFSDDIRDGLHGGWQNAKDKGFVSAAPGMAESIKFGIVASIQNPQIDYNKITDSKAPWAAEPYQTINYASCHDDNTLWDRLNISNPNATEADLIKMDKLAQAVVLTSQGVPFIHAGEEMLRTKQGVANSFKSPDSINHLDWSRKTKYKSVFNYYKQMIALRKAHPAFRMPSARMINTHLEFLGTESEHLIAYRISDHANGDNWKNIVVLLNGDASTHAFKLPAGKWMLAADGDGVSEKGPREASGEVSIPATTAFVLYQY